MAALLANPYVAGLLLVPTPAGASCVWEIRSTGRRMPSRAPAVPWSPASVCMRTSVSKHPIVCALKAVPICGPACGGNATSDRIAGRPAALPSETSMARRNQRRHFRASGFHGQTCSSSARATRSPHQVSRGTCPSCSVETADHSHSAAATNGNPNEAVSRMAPSPDSSTTTDVEAAAETAPPKPPPVRQRNYTWVELMKRVFLVDVLQCERCRGPYENYRSHSSARCDEKNSRAPRPAFPRPATETRRPPDRIVLKRSNDTTEGSVCLRERQRLP